MAQRPDGPPESITFGVFEGLKNTVAPERLSPSDLAAAQNVDLDDAGQLRRRRGYDLKIAGAAHSLWAGPNYTLAVLNGSLGIVRPNFTFEPLVSVGLAPLAYVEVAGTVYYASETASGKILPDLSIAPWGGYDGTTWLSPVVNPTSTLGQVSGQLLGKPPHATALCASLGRIYLAEGNMLWATELYMFDYVDRTRNFMQFESEITMLGSVTDGFYVSTETSVYFMSGPLGQMVRRTAVADGAVRGSMVRVPAASVRPERSDSREALMFLTDTGVFMALDGGTCYNVTDSKVHFPEAVTSGALFRRQYGVNQYVVATNSGGTPVSTARIGDYIDAEIRRFQGA